MFILDVQNTVAPSALSDSVMGPRLWNDIPNEVKQRVGVEIFKQKLKTFLFNKF